MKDGQLMGTNSELMELFLKALAENKRTDTGVIKIERVFVMYIFGVPQQKYLCNFNLNLISHLFFIK